MSIQVSAKSATNWNDVQGTPFQTLMKNIAKFTQEAVGTLNTAAQKLEKLAQSSDNYGKIKF